ncbi:unnamed protein product [Orchesella dallaii]|uniref:Uncharacterized protein n=1 Tax=Orchesella dallaii TaxID=48710 RepID=A0ABP1RK31_9HEXA
MAKLIVAALLLAVVCMALGQNINDLDCQQPNTRINFRGQDCTCLKQTRTRLVYKGGYRYENESYPVTRWSCAVPAPPSTAAPTTAAPAPTSAAPSADASASPETETQSSDAPAA